MDILQLKYFEKTAALESMTMAAAELGISQSNLSKTIAKLEEETGTKLFDRVGKRIHLSEQGIIFLNSAKRILAEYYNCTNQIRYYSNTYTGTISIALMGPTLHPTILRSVVDYSEKYKSVNFIFNTLNEGKLSPRDLEDYDFIVCRNEYLPKGYAGINLIDSLTYVLMSHQHRLANRAEVSLEDIADEPLVVSRYVNVDEAHTAYNMFLINGLNPRIKVTINDNSCNDESIFKHLIIASGRDFIGLIPGGYKCLYEGNSKYALIPLKAHNQVLTFDTCFAWDKSTPLNPVANEFLNFIQINQAQNA